MTMDVARFSLSALVLINVMKILSAMVLHQQLPYTRGIGHLIRQPRLWLSWIPMLIVFAGLLVTWSLGRIEVYAGGAVVLCVYGVRTAAQRAWSEDQVKKLGHYSPAAAILMAIWLVQCLRLMGWSVPAGGEWDVAAGLIGYAWTACGFRKLGQSGWKWAQAPNIALLLAERLYTGPGYRRRLSRWILSRPRWLLIVGLIGLVFEVIGFAFFVPDLRMGYAIVVLISMLINFLLFGFFELEWGVIGIVVAIGSQA